MNTRSLLPLGALLALPLLKPELEPAPILAGRDLASLMPERTLLYVEAPGLSALLERGLQHPFAESVLAAGLDELIRADSGSSVAELLAAADTLVGLPILPTLAELCSDGAALGLAARAGQPGALLVLRADDPQAFEDVLDHLFERVPQLSEPTANYRGTPVWYLDELAFGLRDATLFVANDQDYLRSALELAADEDDAGLAGLPSFAAERGRVEDNLLWAWTDLARIGSLAKNGGKGGGLAKARAMAAKPEIQLLLGPGFGALGRAAVVTAEVALEREDVRLLVRGLDVDAGPAQALLPKDGETAASWPPLGSELNVAEAVVYRDLETLFRERVDLFPPRTLPGFAEATSNLALIFGGLDIGESIFPGLSPWTRLVARPVSFDAGAVPELPLPAAAAVLELRDPSIGPRLVSAFQTGIGLINVDRAQKSRDSMLMRLELVDDVQLTWAHFLAPGEGDGVDLRYNLVPACALVGDAFVIGTHRELVADLVRSALADPPPDAPAPAGVESLSLAGPETARVLADNYDALVMNAVLEEGKTRAKAEADLDGILGLLRTLDGLRVEVHYPSERDVAMSVDLDLRGGRALMVARTLEAFRPGVDGPWDREAAAHLLRRGGFGPAPGDVARALDEGPQRTLARLFAPPGHDPALAEGIRHMLAAGEVKHLQAWWMALILAGGDPLRERVALMWHDHFATSHDKVGDVRMMHRQNELFRALGLGDFRELLHALAKDPAMLVWLDGDQNRRGHPNENFAREVLELFALGIGNYAERDVAEGARAFTGWGTRGRAFAYRAEHHDGGAKTVFGQTGDFTGDELIDLVLAHPACPRWIARRLLAELVSAKPDAETVDAVAALLVENDWAVGPTIERLLASRLFFAAEHRRARIAGPVELVAFSARATGARVPPAEAARAAGRMGQSLFRPPSVKGWDGGRAWINAGTWLARHNLLSQLAAAHGAEGDLRVDLALCAGAPRERDEVPARLCDALLFAPRTEHYERALRDEAARAKDVDQALVRVATLVLTSPEYHLV